MRISCCKTSAGNARAFISTVIGPGRPQKTFLRELNQNSTLSQKHQNRDVFNPSSSSLVLCASSASTTTTSRITPNKILKFSFSTTAADLFGNSPPQSSSSSSKPPPLSTPSPSLSTSASATTSSLENSSSLVHHHSSSSTTEVIFRGTPLAIKTDLYIDGEWRGPNSSLVGGVGGSSSLGGGGGISGDDGVGLGGSLGLSMGEESGAGSGLLSSTNTSSLESSIGGLGVVGGGGTVLDIRPRLPVTNPEEGVDKLSVPTAMEDDVRDAIAAAKRCVEGEWGGVGRGKERAVFLRRMGKMIQERRDHLIRLESFDVGKPKAEAEADVDYSAEAFLYLASLAEQLDTKQGKETTFADGVSGRVFYEPAGVVAAISAWNYPFMMACVKAGSALAAGCAVVLKPSEHACLSSIEFASIAHDCGLPKGALNVINGLGVDVGASLVQHSDINLISLTGSVKTGEWIMQEAAKGIRRVSLELGGKSPMIVLPDANIETTIDWILSGIFMNAGQICSATSRVIVHESIYSILVNKLVNAAKRIRAAPPVTETDDERRMGPIINSSQLTKVLGFIERAKADGLKLGGGGGQPEGGGRGFFVEPTIFVDVPPTAEIWQEEIFGPVLCVCSYSTPEEALSLANSSPFGLAAAVMGGGDSARHFAQKLKAGTVWINCSQNVYPETPFGGMKQSGFGREMGEDALHDFLEVKQVTEAPENYAPFWFTSSEHE